MRLTGLIKKWLLIFTCFIISTVATAQKIDMPQQVIFGKLDNGLSYYIVPKGDRGKIRLTMLSNTGALAEKQDEHGYSHVLEHMMFKGSKNYPDKASYEIMDNMGMRISKEMSAFTSGHSTEFNLYIPESNEPYMRKSLLLFKDWMFDLRIKEKSLEIEKQVIIEEINRGGTPASPYLNGTYLEGHDVLGDKNAINSVTVDKINVFYKKHYTPDQLAILVYGKIDETTALSLIKEVFDKVPVNHKETESKYPDFTKETIVAEDYHYKLKKKYTPLIIASKRTVGPINSYENLKQSFINSVFSKLLESRFDQSGNKNLSESSVRVSNVLYNNQLTNIRLKILKNETYENILNDFCEVLAQVEKYGFSEEEIGYHVHNSITRFEKFRNEVTIPYSAVEKHFLTGNVPISGQKRYEFANKVLSNLKSDDFTPLIDNFIKDHKTILFDSTSTAYTSKFTKSYILDKISKIKSLNVEPAVVKIPQKSQSKKNKLVDFKINIDQSAKIEKRIELADNLLLLKYENGHSVVLDNNPGKYTVIKLVGKDGLNSIPEGDRDHFKASLRLLNGSYGDYTRSEISAIERSLGAFKKAAVDNFGYEYEVKGNPENFEQLIKLFNISITKTVQPDTKKFNFNKKKAKTNNGYAPFLDIVNSNMLPNKVDSIYNAASIERLFKYNQLLKTNFKASIIYISGILPDNAEALVSKYIATIPASKVNNLKILIDKSILTNKIVVKEFEWKRPISIINYLFTSAPEKKLTFKDELILEAISQYANIKLLEVLREKYGLVYSTGTTAITRNEPFDFHSLSVRYMIDPLGIDKSRLILENEILKPLSTGQITDKKTEQLKAMLTSVYLTSFYDDDQIGRDWLKRNLKYNKVLTPKFIQESIDSISTEDIKKMMVELIKIDKHFVLIRKPKQKAK